MRSCYFIIVQFEEFERVEYTVFAVSAQDAVDNIRNKLSDIPCDVVRVSLAQTNWY